MLYKTNADLPESVQNVLPEHAQKIYLEAFNNAWEQHDEPEE
jgi:cation transport regulator